MTGNQRLIGFFGDGAKVNPLLTFKEETVGCFCKLSARLLTYAFPFCQTILFPLCDSDSGGGKTLAARGPARFCTDWRSTFRRSEYFGLSVGGLKLQKGGGL